MAKRVSVDRWLFGATLLLVLLGLVMVFSASAVMAKDRFGSPYTFVIRQIGWAFAGVVAMVVLMRVDYRRYKHPAVFLPCLASPWCCWWRSCFLIARTTPIAGFALEVFLFNLLSWPSLHSSCSSRTSSKPAPRRSTIGGRHFCRRCCPAFFAADREATRSGNSDGLHGADGFSALCGRNGN